MGVLDLADLLHFFEYRNWILVFQSAVGKMLISPAKGKLLHGI